MHAEKGFSLETSLLGSLQHIQYGTPHPASYHTQHPPCKVAIPPKSPGQYMVLPFPPLHPPRTKRQTDEHAHSFRKKHSQRADVAYVCMV